MGRRRRTDEAGRRAACLRFRAEEVVGQEFSDQAIEFLTAEQTRFRGCRFERTLIDNASFGAGTSMSYYLGCSFDGSYIRATALGRARFEGCSFQEVHLHEWFCFEAEFVDCVFTGRGEKLIFDGRVPDDAQRELGRASNEFRGNDFTQMQLQEVDFRGGIDLTRQGLPSGDEYLLLERPRSALCHVRDEVEKWTNTRHREDALGLVALLMEDVDRGQAQLFLRPADFSDDDPEMVRELVDLLVAADEEAD